MRGFLNIYGFFSVIDEHIFRRNLEALRILNHLASVQDSFRHNNILTLISNNSNSKSSGQFNDRKKQQRGNKNLIISWIEYQKALYTVPHN